MTGGKGECPLGLALMLPAAGLCGTLRIPVCMDICAPPKATEACGPLSTRVGGCGRQGSKVSKNISKFFKKSGPRGQENQTRGRAEKSLPKKVVRPQALEGALKPPTFIYHFFR